MINLENISFDHCIKCTVCTIYCPVARVNPIYPGPKQSGPDTERLRIKNPDLLDESLKYCSNCKRCEIACPSDVRIADIIQTAKWKYSPKRFKIRDFLLSHTDLMGTLSTSAAPVVNRITGLSLTKSAMEAFLNISSKRRFPAYEPGTFRRWYGRMKSEQEAFSEKVIYYHGCYVNYNDHELGKTVVRTLNKLGVGVTLIPEKCCGVPLIANADLPGARKNARYNIQSIETAVEKTHCSVVSTSSSCTFALKHEYPGLLEIDNSAVFNKIHYITAYLSRLFAQGPVPELQPVNLTAAYHAPCHLERMGGVIHTLDLLSNIPGLKIVLMHSECCGISGTYGFKKECYDIAQDVGEELFKRIADAAPDIVITDCETCKWQIEMSTPFRTVHPIMILAQSLGVYTF